GSDHHIYAPNEVVPIYANKIGPFANPTYVSGETYHYFDLPFCHPPDGKAYQWEGLGEVLEGDRLVSTAFDMRFATDQASVTLCSRNLTSEELDAFRSAIKSDYYYQMFLDDLPLWGFVGKVEGAEGAQRAYLFTHTHFDLLHTVEGEVIQVDVSADASKTIDLGPVAGPHPAPPLAVSFSYSAAWKVTDVPYARRMDKYARYSFLPQHLEIHWFSIINSCVTVLLLTGFLAAILLRVLRRDLLRYARREEGGLPGADDEDDDQGWKNVHGDVFRPPPAPAA
ncbi:endomembrane protein 70, partial [Helicosporidium sp. ATCC 50920]